MAPWKGSRCTLVEHRCPGGPVWALRNRCCGSLRTSPVPGISLARGSCSGLSLRATPHLLSPCLTGQVSGCCSPARTGGFRVIAERATSCEEGKHLGLGLSSWVRPCSHPEQHRGMRGDSASLCVCGGDNPPACARHGMARLVCAAVSEECSRRQGGVAASLLMERLKGFNGAGLATIKPHCNCLQRYLINDLFGCASSSKTAGANIKAGEAGFPRPRALVPPLACSSRHANFRAWAFLKTLFAPGWSLPWWGGGFAD